MVHVAKYIDMMCGGVCILNAALGAFAVLILHICWSVIWFSGWSTLHLNGYLVPSSVFGWVKVGTVLVTHMLVACLVSH
jgi:hypothetical protein